MNLIHLFLLSPFYLNYWCSIFKSRNWPINDTSTSEGQKQSFINFSGLTKSIAKPAHILENSFRICRSNFHQPIKRCYGTWNTFYCTFIESPPENLLKTQLKMEYLFPYNREIQDSNRVSPDLVNCSFEIFVQTNSFLGGNTHNSVLISYTF